MAISIANKSQCSAWLREAGSDQAFVVAFRAVMRAFPYYRPPDNRDDLTLGVIRGIFTAGVICKYYDERNAPAVAVIKETSRYKPNSYAAEYRKEYIRDTPASGYVLTQEAAASDAIAYAAKALLAGDTFSAIAFSVDAQSYLGPKISYFEGAYEGDYDAAAVMWSNIEADVNFLLKFKAKSLFVTPLWPGKVFESWPDYWAGFKRDADESGRNWNLWSEWYDRHLYGEATDFGGLTLAQNELFCLELAGESDAFWRRDPAIVNKEILDRLNTLRFQEIPAQAPGPLVTFEREGKVARQLSSPPGDPSGRLHSARQALMESIEDFVAAFPNHNDPGLERALARLRDALGADYSQFDALRAGVAAERIHQRALRADELFLPEKAIEVVALNVNIGRTLGNIGAWTDFCRGLDNDADPAVPELEAVKEVGQELVKTDALEDEVKLELNYEVLALEGEDGRPRERKILLRGVMNVLATMSKIALDYAKFVQGAAGEGHKDGIKDVTKAATVGAFMGLAALLLPLAGQSPMFAFLVPVLTYLSKFASK